MITYADESIQRVPAMHNVCYQVGRAEHTQAVPELALMSTTAGGAAQLVAEALRAGEGAVRPDLLDALRGAAGAVLPMDAVQESPQPAPEAPAAAQQTVVRVVLSAPTA